MERWHGKTDTTSYYRDLDPWDARHQDGHGYRDGDSGDALHPSSKFCLVFHLESAGGKHASLLLPALRLGEG